jgi:peptidylprolyl isomerase
MAQVKKGDRVKIHYTGKLKDGSVFESNMGGEPLAFTVGKGKVIKGFENAVIGMTPGQTKTVTIAPAMGYGPKDPALVVVRPLSELPPGAAVGQTLTVNLPDGTSAEAKLFKLEGEQASLDANHPLAGRNLTFDLKLVAIG